MNSLGRERWVVFSRELEVQCKCREKFRAHCNLPPWHWRCRAISSLWQGVLLLERTHRSSKVQQRREDAVSRERATYFETSKSKGNLVQQKNRVQ